MHHAFGNYDPSEYLYSDVSIIENNRGLVGEQLRSFQYAIQKLKQNVNAKNILIHKPGPLESNEEYLKELSETYYRGLMEVDQWIQESQEKRHAD